MARVAIGLGAFAGGLLAGWALFAEPAEAPRRADPVRTTRATEQGARAERPAPETGGPAREDGTSEAVRLDADRKLVVTQPASVEEALRRRMAQIYRERHDGEEIPQDWLDAAVDTALRAVLRAPETHATRSANWVRARELARRAAGEISSPADLLMQARSSQSISADLLAGAGRSRNLQSQPIDVEARVHERERSSAFVRGGVLPPGKALVVERVDISAVLGMHGRWRRNGRLAVTLPGGKRLKWEGANEPFRLSLIGRGVVYAGQEESTSMRLSRGAAQVRVRGTLMNVAEARKVQQIPFVLEGYEGFLTAEPILLQVIADHGGGNPRTLYLSGGDNGRFDTLSPVNVWDDTLDLANGRASIAHYRGAGMTPPGKAYRLHRIEYRARLDPKGRSHGRFIVRAAGKVLFETNAEKEREPRGFWEGDILIKRGQERTVSVTCTYFGIGEAIFYGEIVDAPR